MKKLFFSLAVIVAAFSASAQSESMDSKFRFSIGAEPGVPIGDLGDFSSFSIGGSVQGDYWVDENLAITLHSGYTRFTEKDDNGLELGVIPILAGIRVRLGQSKAYGSAQLGVGILTSNSESTSAFGYAPGIGYQFTDKFDALLKYQAFSKDSFTYGTLALRIAYNF